MKKWQICGIALCLLPVCGYAADREPVTGYSIGITRDVQDKLYHQFTSTSYAVWVSSHVGVKLTNVGFEDNAGTGLMLEPWGHIVEMNDADFSRNLGGGLEIQRLANIDQLLDVSFTDNENSSGAGIYLFAGANPIGKMENILFSGNQARLNGGGIYAATNSQSMKNVQFQNNQANQGGALFLADSFQLSGQGVSFEDNQAQLGGAIYATGDLEISGGNIQFSGNAAQQGSAIYAGGDLSLRATGGDIVFTNNQQTAIFMEQAGSTLMLQPTASGNIVFNDTLAATDTLTLVVKGESSGKVVFQQRLPDTTTILLKNGQLNLNPQVSWENIRLSAQGGTFDLTDGVISSWNMGTLELADNLSVSPEVDLAGGTMDSFRWGTVSGQGAIVVDKFNLWGAAKEEGGILSFMQGPNIPQVIMPDTAYNKLYAYNAVFHPDDGSVSFVLKGDWNSVRSFNPAALLQPAMMYGSLFLQLDHSAQVMLPQNGRFLREEDVASSFYVQPFYEDTDFTFANDLVLQTNSAGVSAGWYSGDLEWFNSAAAIWGVHAGIRHANLEYEAGTLDTNLLYAGATLHLYKGGLFAAGGAFAGQNIQNADSVQADQSVLFGNARLLAGYNWDVYDSVWFLQPYISTAYAWQAKGNDWTYQDVVLFAQAGSVLEMKGGLKLLKSYQDSWHWNIGVEAGKRLDMGETFYANEQKLPIFDSDMIYEAKAGISTEGSGPLNFGGEFFVRFGGSEGFGGQIRVEF